jgi:hypothetical protein
VRTVEVVYSMLAVGVCSFAPEVVAVGVLIEGVEELPWKKIPPVEVLTVAVG